MRETWTSRDAFAGCFYCNGSEGIWFGKNCQGVAARHHDATGHTTWVDVSLRITYGTPGGSDRKAPPPITPDLATMGLTADKPKAEV